ncbi:MAG: DUF2807 domain-containing protein [Alistipes sp.]|jgi:hypothetical protein
MKIQISSAIALLFSFAGFAQTIEPISLESSDTAQQEWLQSFSAVEINAPLNILFIRIPAAEAPKIIYDTKGAYTTKFRFDIKNHVLRINEKADSRRPEQTIVTVYYNSLESLSLFDATASFREPIIADLFDLTIGSRAALTTTLDVKDLKMNVTGNSSATLDGSARYLTLDASTGKVDALNLVVMAARVNATSGASVMLDATERLEATTSTSGTVYYKTEPSIMRGGIHFMGGNIEQAK